MSNLVGVKTDVLIVDDNADHRKFIAAALKKESITTDQAENGQEALRKLRQKSFRMVVSDVEMENGDGLWLLTQIQAEMPSVPVILVSADAIDKKTAISYGALDFLLKPCPLVVLRSSVRAALQSVAR